jgi:hypothetical protein
MYRAADPEAGWTRELRLMHRTAWLLVSFSAAMNAVHAPNWWARPVLAAVPALAAWLIELQLRSKLHHVKPGQDDDARPGPARLLALLWQHAWAELFALLGLDARTSSSAIARAALVQRAAMRVYRLRLALETGKTRRVGRRRRLRPGACAGAQVGHAHGRGRVRRARLPPARGCADADRASRDHACRAAAGSFRPVRAGAGRVAPRGSRAAGSRGRAAARGRRTHRRA